MADAQGNTGNKSADDATAMLMEGLAKLGEMVSGLGAHMSAPTEIVRDPATGKVVGTRKVMN